MGLKLENKMALVTGGGSGIGKVVCIRFAEQGANVVVTDIDENTAEATAKKITDNGGSAIAMESMITLTCFRLYGHKPAIQITRAAGSR